MGCSYVHTLVYRLNESPSQKEGKLAVSATLLVGLLASMKVPPKRKGNCTQLNTVGGLVDASMKVPPKRKGNVNDGEPIVSVMAASMKVPPKRKGNSFQGSESPGLREPQ